MKDYVRDLYKKLSESRGKTLETFHYNYFKLEDGELCYRGKRKPLMTKGVLNSVGTLMDILGKCGLHSLGFDIPRGKLTGWQAVMLNKVKEELPSESDITKADDIKLQEIAKSMEDLIMQMRRDQSQTDDLFKHPLCKLLGLDTQLRSI